MVGYGKQYIDIVPEDYKWMQLTLASGAMY